MRVNALMAAGSPPPRGRTEERVIRTLSNETTFVRNLNALPVWKYKRARMTNHYRARVSKRMGTDLAKRRAGLITQQIDNVTWAPRAKRAQPPEEGLAGKGRVGAECKRAHHVGAAAHAAVEKDRRAAAQLGGDRRQHIDRGGQRLDLPAAVIGNPNAVDTELDGARGVGRMHDALEH